MSAIRKLNGLLDAFRGAILLALVPVMAMLAAGAALAEKRVALVVGNGSYTAVSPLDNPVSDARLMAESLARAGFEVTLVIDGSLSDLRGRIAEFGRALREAGPETTGLFYYAGHGVQSFGSNYLLPVDAVLTDAADLDLVALEASSVLRQMASARNRTNIVILDACRDNPFQTIPDLNENGLAEMKAPTGTFLSYATAPGSVALDGLDNNSPFTRALAQQMTVQGTPIEEMFRKVRVAVLEETGGQQTPWDTSSLTQPFYFVPAEQLSPEDIAAKAFWDQVKQTGDPMQVLLFLRAYPGSRYEDEARALLSAAVNQELAPAGQAAAPAAPAAPPPADNERALIETARASGALADYEAYLAAYPDGTYSELARLEIDTLRAKLGDANPAAATPPEQPKSPAVASSADAPPDAGPVVFTTPVAVGPPDVAGRTIAELIQGSPHYPPVEGLPEAYWKDQTCSNCHQWTPDALCTQAKVYLGEIAERSLNKQHPYGGAFKRHLRAWAQGGCAP